MSSKSEISRKKLTKALIELLQICPFDRITVSNLTEKAGVSRSAFYSNYKHIEDILTDAILESLKDSFGEKFSDESYAYGREFVYDYIDYFDKYGKLLLAISKWDLLDFINISASKAVNPAMKSYYSDPYIQNYIEYYQYFTIASIYFTCLAWLKKGKKETKEELYDICLHFYDISLQKRLEQKREQE